MRTQIDAFEQRFEDLDRRQRQLLASTSDDRLFWSPVEAPDSMFTLSVGGAVIRSAAMIEQVFLGITRRLWDDPFEWTLPEKLFNKTIISEYLDDVAETRQIGLAFFKSDDDLKRELPAPQELRPVGLVLCDAIDRAENFLGRGEGFQAIEK